MGITKMPCKPRLHLFQQSVDKAPHPFGALLGHLSPGGGLEAVLQLEELGFEVIQAETLVVVLTMLGPRIRSVIQRAAHAAADIEAAGYANQANGVETIGVLQDLRFQRLRRMPAEKLCASIAWATAAMSAGDHSSWVSVSVACCAAMREAR